MIGARVARPADEEGERGRVATTTVPRYRAGKAPEWLQQDAEEQALVPRGGAPSRAASAGGAADARRPGPSPAAAAPDPPRLDASPEAAGVTAPVVLRRVEDPRLARLARLEAERAGAEGGRSRRRRGDVGEASGSAAGEEARGANEPPAADHRSRGRRREVDGCDAEASATSTAGDGPKETAVAAPVVLRRGGGPWEQGDDSRERRGFPAADARGERGAASKAVGEVEGTPEAAKAQRGEGRGGESGASSSASSSEEEGSSSGEEEASSSSEDESDGPALPRTARALRPIFVPKSQRSKAVEGGVGGAAVGGATVATKAAGPSAAPDGPAAFSAVSQAPLTAAADEAWEARSRARAAEQEEAAARRRAETAAQARRAEAAEAAEALERAGAGRPQGLSDVDTDDDAADAVEELRLWRERELARLERDELARGARAAAAAIGRAARDGLPLMLTAGGAETGPGGSALGVAGRSRSADGSGSGAEGGWEPSARSGRDSSAAASARPGREAGGPPSMHPDRAARASSPESPSGSPPRARQGQRFYHRGAFFQEEEDDASVRGRAAGVREAVASRDASAPTGADRFDRSLLPEVMRVRNFGRRGQTKYRSLKDEDTTFEGRDRGAGGGRGGGAGERRWDREDGRGCGSERGYGRDRDSHRDDERSRDGCRGNADRGYDRDEQQRSGGRGYDREGQRGHGQGYGRGYGRHGGSDGRGVAKKTWGGGGVGDGLSRPSYKSK